ncbi:Hsp70 family protein [Ktedonosporobacter rubrisoli]|uniref:Hsp70 family protein n=1 Tax=Ktedonosporobacter rubrisoli TaxID=2509675 RepID=UPI0013EE4225|nr:Hsp70 family protein [Ktedonosporobacter rubrisoli]
MAKQLISKAVGIDLGTTNSVIAIMNPADTDIVIHRDPVSKRETTPSCVWKDPRKGEIVVGRKAFSRIGTAPAPIHSIKRKMGRQEKVRLGNEELSPEEISAHILREMKGQIEEDVKGFETNTTSWQVDRAIITVPAYFDLPQIEATRKAGEQAGLQVLELLHEPTAAACYYCWHTHIQNGIFLVYDLGGGTFDVSILRCRAGAFEVLGISGNNYLGGDDIDEALANELLRRLQSEEQWELNLNLKDDEEDRLRFEKMKKLMEGVKKKLSTEHEFLLRDTMSIQDQAHNWVEIEMLFERQEIEAIMLPIIKRTIPYCLEALEKAHEKAEISLADVDAIILAGGSTHIPLVRQLVRQELCANPNAQAPRAKCAEPVYEDVDSIVALGAAIRAAASGGLIIYNSERTVRIAFRGLGTTGSQQAHLGGQVSTLSQEIDLSGGHIRLTIPALGYDDDCDLGPAGNFSFTRIPLQRAAENLLNFEVFDSKDELIASASRPVTQSQDAPLAIGGGDTAVLAKTIALEVVRANKLYRKELIKSPASLPTSASFQFVHPGSTSHIQFSLYQLEKKIKEISVNVPEDLPRGAPIDLHINVDEQANITCNGTIGELPFRFSVEAPEDRYIREDDVRKLDKQFQQLPSGQSSSLKEAWEETTQRVNTAIEHGDVARAAHDFGELENLWQSVAPAEKEVLQPPRTEFDNLVKDCLAINDEIYNYDRMHDKAMYSNAINEQRRLGEMAFAASDQEAYTAAYNMLESLCKHLANVLFSKLPADIREQIMQQAAKSTDEETTRRAGIKEAMNLKPWEI